MDAGALFGSFAVGICWALGLRKGATKLATKRANRRYHSIGGMFLPWPAGKHKGTITMEVSSRANGDIAPNRQTDGDEVRASGTWGLWTRSVKRGQWWALGDRLRKPPIDSDLAQVLCFLHGQGLPNQNGFCTNSSATAPANLGKLL